MLVNARVVLVPLLALAIDREPVSHRFLVAAYVSSARKQARRRARRTLLLRAKS